MTKAVVLAAGKGVRMRPLTLDRPKPLLEINGKAIIDYVLEALPEEINEVIIAVNYKGEQIKKHIGKENRGKKIKYVQGSDMGNVYSFLATGKYLKNERFLLVYGDEIPNPINVKKCLEKDLSILTFDGGIWDGIMVLNTDIFMYKPTDEMFRSLVQKFLNDHDVEFIEDKNFVGGLNTPADLKRVQKLYG
jgi:GTP:adenosylcobinamide-phosphate guanylyltransferase